MRAWTLEIATLLYHLGLAVWIGGFLVLGPLVAPALFRRLGRAEAGEIFGGILRRFARVRLVALLVALAAAGVRFALWELQVLGSAPPGMVAILTLRWVALGAMAAGTVYELGWLEQAIGSRLAAVRAEGREASDDSQFRKLHLRSERMAKGLVGVAIVALWFG